MVWSGIPAAAAAVAAPIRKLWPEKPASSIPADLKATQRLTATVPYHPATQTVDL